MIDSIGGPSVYIDSDLMRINFAYQKTIDELGKLQNREFDKITKSSKAKTKSIITCYYSKPRPVRANAIGFAKVEKMVIV